MMDERRLTAADQFERVSTFKVPTRDELLEELRALAADTDGEEAHLQADTLVLRYINDAEIVQAFTEVRRWYG